MKVSALIQLKNEAARLPGLLDNIAAGVDSIIALDDGSTDGTRQMLEAHDLVEAVLSNEPGSEWDERSNQSRLVLASREAQADWVLCIDADERLEDRFVIGLREVVAAAHEEGLRVLRLVLRELWDDPQTYRIDGVWGRKTLCRIFHNDPSHRRFDPRRLHRFWMPLELVADLEGHSRLLDVNLYHLQMIRPQDRQARLEKYLALDPDRLYQPLGYEYFVDENGLELESIPDGRGYSPLP